LGRGDHLTGWEKPGKGGRGGSQNLGASKRVVTKEDWNLIQDLVNPVRGQGADGKENPTLRLGRGVDIVGVYRFTFPKAGSRLQGG